MTNWDLSILQLILRTQIFHLNCFTRKQAFSSSLQGINYYINKTRNMAFLLPIFLPHDRTRDQNVTNSSVDMWLCCIHLHSDHHHKYRFQTHTMHHLNSPNYWHIDLLCTSHWNQFASNLHDHKKRGKTHL